MTDPSWADGYVVDIGYTHHYFRELAPSAMRFIALLGSMPADNGHAPFVYCELGCGNGHSTALHAAANPLGQFYGVDFNPVHIQHARKLAQDAGISNVHFLEKSFAELLETDMPDVDIVAMHGVHSWINHENRQHVVEFLRRRLKPGGLFHVSYNCLPGLAQVAPLQRLLMEHAALRGGGLPDRVRGALEFARRFEQAGADYFHLNPLARARLDRIAGQDQSYVAHEYFNASWAPAYHADVARELSAAKLGYVGSAVIMDNFDQFVLKPEMAKLLGEVGDRILAETLKDYARNQQFRRDLFSRGVSKASAAELQTALEGMRFSLLRPRSACKLQGKVNASEISLQPEVHEPILDALARKAMCFREIVAAPELARLNGTQARQAVFALAALGNLAAALPEEGEDLRRLATDRYNQAILAAATNHPNGTMLASPVLGCGIRLGLVELLLFRHGGENIQAVEAALAGMGVGGTRIERDGRPVETLDDLRTLVKDRARFFREELEPFLRIVGIA